MSRTERTTRIAHRFDGPVRLPADFWLVAAANACPCGNNGAETRACTCSASTIDAYRARLIGDPLLKGALEVKLARMPRGAALLDSPTWPCTADLRARVATRAAELP